MRIVAGSRSVGVNLTRTPPITLRSVGRIHEGPKWATAFRGPSVREFISMENGFPDQRIARMTDSAGADGGNVRSSTVGV